MPNLKSILKVGYPFLAQGLSMIGGPFGTMASNALGQAIGLSKPNPSEDELSAAMAKGLTGDQIAALKKAENDYQLQVAQMGYTDVETLAKIAADDRDSARKREEVVRDNTPRNLAYIYAGGFFLTLAAEICMAIWVKDINQLVMKSIDILLGAELGMVLGSKEYYFGSSKGQDDQNQVIHNLSK
jgi:hypothetical protein